jgi:hypothetical protein
MMIDFLKAIVFSNGVRVINCTPHTLVFRDGEVDVTVEPCGVLVNARAIETPAGKAGEAQLVKTQFLTTPQGEDELAEIETGVPGALVVGSIISAQAYPGRVVGMTPAPGFERVAPAEKRMSTVKFTVF